MNPLFVLLGCTLMMVQDYNGSAKAIAINVLMGLILICVSYNVFEYFEVAKIYAEEKKLIKELRIVELFCFLFLLAHIFVCAALLRASCCTPPSMSSRRAAVAGLTCPTSPSPTNR